MRLGRTLVEGCVIYTHQTLSSRLKMSVVFPSCMTSSLSHSINLTIFLFICRRGDETGPSAMARRVSVSLPLPIFIRESLTRCFMDSAARAGQRKSLLILDLARRRDGGCTLAFSLSLPLFLPSLRFLLKRGGGGVRGGGGGRHSSQ